MIRAWGWGPARLNKERRVDAGRAVRGDVCLQHRGDADGRAGRGEYVRRLERRLHGDRHVSGDDGVQAGRDGALHETGDGVHGQLLPHGCGGVGARHHGRGGIDGDSARLRAVRRGPASRSRAIRCASRARSWIRRRRCRYFMARYYRNTHGRFTQVDEVHVDEALFDPQQWNRYAYARNNPLAYGDPTGEFAIALVWTAPVAKAVVTTAAAAAVGATIAAFGKEIAGFFKGLFGKKSKPVPSAGPTPPPTSMGGPAPKPPPSPAPGPPAGPDSGLQFCPLGQDCGTKNQDQGDQGGNGCRPATGSLCGREEGDGSIGNPRGLADSGHSVPKKPCSISSPFAGAGIKGERRRVGNWRDNADPLARRAFDHEQTHGSRAARDLLLDLMEDEKVSGGRKRELAGIAKNLGKAGRVVGAFGPMLMIVEQLLWPDTLYAAEADWPGSTTGC